MARFEDELFEDIHHDALCGDALVAYLEHAERVAHAPFLETMFHAVPDSVEPPPPPRVFKRIGFEEDVDEPVEPPADARPTVAESGVFRRLRRESVRPAQDDDAFFEDTQLGEIAPFDLRPGQRVIDLIAARVSRFFDAGSTPAEGRAMPSEERAELRGTILDDRYRIGSCIGVGGTGVVFEATRLSDGHNVVIKTLRPVFAHNHDLARRLRREAEVSRNVSHPAIVPVLDEGTLEDATPYVVMERVRGEAMNRYLRRQGVLGVAETLVIAMRVADVLHRSHASGYVHRDVKPEHIILDRDADGELRVWLLDYGVCAADTAPVDERERERGRVYGTPSYVAPEQASGDPEVDGRADVFGLGIVVFEALAGRLPFSGSTVTNLLRRIIREDAPRLALNAPQVGRELDVIVARMLSRDKAHRFPNARAVGRALAPFVRDRRAVERELAATLQLESSRADAVPTLAA